MFNFSRWKTAFGASAAVLSVALLTAPAANAGVIAYSNLNVTLGLSAGAELIDLSTVSFTNNTSSTAGFGGDGSAKSAVNDVLMTCSGSCAGIGENNFDRVSLASPTAEFVRGDALLSGAINTQDGAVGSTVAESQIIGGSTTSFARGEVGSTITLTTLEFTTNDGAGVISLAGSALGSLFLQSDRDNAESSASYSWSISGFQAGILFAGFAPEKWNQRISLSGLGTATEGVNEMLTFDFNVLANTSYRLEIAHRSSVDSQVPVPATLALFGLGLCGLSGLAAARRRKAA